MQPPSALPPTRSTGGSREPVRLAAGRTQLELEWAGDRWRHRVSLEGRVLAESIEGAAEGGDPCWPASPAIVEISRIEVAGRPAVVGVGRAGRSHFSLSITLHPDQADTVVFEAACRIVEPAPWLGSTYRTAAGQPPRLITAAAGPPPATVQWAYRIGPGGIEPGG